MGVSYYFRVHSWSSVKIKSSVIFVNSQDFGTLHLSDYNHFFIQKNDLLVNKKQIISDEKMRNSGNCIYDYAHSFIGEHF